MKTGQKYQELGEVCNVINGLWTGKKEPFVNIAVIRNTNFSKDCRLKLDDVAYIDVESKQFKTRKLEVGDIIIEKSGGSEKQPVGRAVMFDIPDGDFSFSNFTAALRVKDKSYINPKFLHKCLLGHYLKGETLKMQSKTTGLHNLDMKAYQKLPVPALSLTEQERIVAELDLLTGIIDKQKVQLKELDTLAQSIFYDMFKEELTSSATRLLKDIASYRIGLTYKPTDVAEKGIIVLRSSNIQDNSLDFKDIVRVNLAVDSKKLVSDGDILMCARNGSARLVGKVARIRDIDEEMSFGAFMTTIKSQYNDFLFYFFLSPFFRSQLGSAQTATINQITSKMLDEIQLNVPSLEKQAIFAQKIQSIESQKASINQSIAETQKLFDYTMDKYFG
ncbi:MAG: restriction endonuclease subunit S [Bacteroidales bacterium]|nr:restriction endonuclease subunit S [Candidatus Cacconaster scatequi]